MARPSWPIPCESFVACARATRGGPHSDAARSTQKHSCAARSPQKHSCAFRSTQRHPEALRSTQKHSEAPARHQTPPEVVGSHQKPLSHLRGQREEDRATLLAGLERLERQSQRILRRESTRERRRTSSAKAWAASVRVPRAGGEAPPQQLDAIELRQSMAINGNQWHLQQQQLDALELR